MTHLELEKLLDELGIKSVSATESADKSTYQTAKPLPLVFSIGTYSRLEQQVCGDILSRFQIRLSRPTGILAPFKLIARHSKPGLPVVVMVGRNGSLTELSALAVVSKFYGRKVYFCMAAGVVDSLTTVKARLLSFVASYADRNVAYSGHEAKALKTLGPEVEVLYPFIETGLAMPTYCETMQPRIISYVRANGTEVLTLIRAYKLVKAKYPRAMLTIVTDSCSVEFDPVAGVESVNLESDLYSRFGSSEIYVNLSSLSGGFAPFMIAQSCGLLSVLSDLGDAREFANHGENALICRLNDPISLADSIFALVERDSVREPLRDGMSLCRSDYSYETLKDDWARFLGICR